jgi:SAM-dependent methyltransferase
MSAPQLDESKAKAFAERLLGDLRGGAVTLMASVGHRTGLFDTMAALEPATSEQIADAAGLNERYVREWLGAMVVGGIVSYDPQRRSYVLPPEHAAVLTRAAGADNIATVAAYFPVFAGVEDEVVGCFRNGGGVPYSSYARFHEVMNEAASARFDATLIDRVLPAVPGLVGRLEAGIAVADIGCGSGHAINLMAKAFSRSEFVGYDFSEEGLAGARREADKLGLRNARFEVKDVATLDAQHAFALITAFDAIHDQAQPREVLRAIADALDPRGTFLMVDIAASSKLEENLDHPFGPILYTFSCLHCVPVSLAFGGEGLGTAWGEQKALELLGEAGFRSVEVKHIEGDIVNSYYIASTRALA